MKVLGIDEAGRGALVGPLVVGGFMIDESLLGELKEAGVTDSKLLSREKRAELYSMLKNRGEFRTIKISPQEIDMKNKVGVNLNQLEISKMIMIINELKPDVVFIDCPSHNEARIKSLFEAEVSCKVVCENKADLNYTIVGAGSIMAKHERDEAIAALESSLQTVIGLGYPGDERTISFARLALKNKDWLIHVRHSWETFQRLKGESEQKSLIDY